jgi:hypothetical protein
MQKARGHPTLAGLPLLVSRRFQVLFHSPPGVLFTFPSRYLFTIGRRGVFSLGGWSPLIPTGFHVPRGTRDSTWVLDLFRLRDCHPLWWIFPDPSATCLKTFLVVPQPPVKKTGFRLLPFRSPLLRESRLISFPLGTEMFHFPRFASLSG